MLFFLKKNLQSEKTYKTMEKFRIGIGAIILDKDNDLIALQRADFKMNWQGVEGGCDLGESYKETLVREVFEEIGVKKEEFDILKQFEKTLKYSFPKNIQRENFVGQEKMFFLIKLNENFKKFKFDNNLDEIEFINAKKISAKKLLEVVPDFKKDIYEKVLKEFKFL